MLWILLTLEWLLCIWSSLLLEVVLSIVKHLLLCIIFSLLLDYLNRVYFNITPKTGFLMSFGDYFGFLSRSYVPGPGDTTLPSVWHWSSSYLDWDNLRSGFIFFFLGFAIGESRLYEPGPIRSVSNLGSFWSDLLKVGLPLTFLLLHIIYRFSYLYLISFLISLLLLQN